MEVTCNRKTKCNYKSCFHQKLHEKDLGCDPGECAGTKEKAYCQEVNKDWDT